MSDNDQAAVEALCKISLPPVGVNITGEYAVPYRDGARAILNAIRAGKVPGVCSVPDDDIPLQHERDVLNKVVKDTAAILSRTTVAFEGGLAECAKAVLDEVAREKARADKAEAEAAKCNDLCAEIGGDDPAECLDIVRGDNMAHEGVVKELDKATAERDRLAVLLRECRNDMINGLTLGEAADLEHRIDAALAEVWK